MHGLELAHKKAQKAFWLGIFLAIMLLSTAGIILGFILGVF